MINILYLNVGAELYGSDVILLEIVKNIDKSKFKPYVILPCDGPLVDELHKYNINVKVMKYPVLRRKYFNPVGIIKYAVNFIKYSKQILEFCKDNKIDLIHSNTSAVLEGAYVWKKTKIKHIWHVHEMLDKPVIVRRVLNKIMFNRCDKVLAVSNAVKNHLEKYKDCKSSKIEVIHNGIDLKKFNNNNDTDYLKKEFNIKDDEKIVGFIGRINAIKGQEDFVKAMEIAFEKCEKTKALIVGSAYDGQEWRVEQLLKIIDKSRFKDRFIFAGYRTDVKNIQSLIDVFVLPSIRYDSFPTVVLEAMASSKPVVAYDCGGVVEMVRNGKSGFIVKQNDINTLADKISVVLNDSNLQYSMGVNGRKIMESLFSSKSYISKVEKLYLHTI